MYTRVAVRQSHQEPDVSTTGIVHRRARDRRRPCCGVGGAARPAGWRRGDPRGQGILRNKRRHSAFGHRRLVRGPRSGVARRSQGQPRSSGGIPRGPFLDGPRPRPDLPEHEPPGDRGPLSLPHRSRDRPGEPHGCARSRIHAADASLDHASRRHDPRPLPSPGTTGGTRRLGARCGRVPTTSPSRLLDHLRRGGAGQRRLRIPVPGAGHQRRHRRRNADGRRGGSPTLRDGVLQRLRHRGSRVHGDQDRLLRIRHLLP